MKIQFSQEVDVVKADGEDDAADIFVIEPSVLKTLDGVKYLDEKFSDYILDSEFGDDEFRQKPIRGGTLSLRYDEKKNKVFVDTEYEIQEGLSDEEIEYLKNHTAIQLTDGMGSNFLQFFEPEANVGLGFGGTYGKMDVKIRS